MSMMRFKLAIGGASSRSSSILRPLMVDRARVASTSVLQSRKYASSAQDPREDAKKIIESVPPNNFLSQTGTILVGTGLAAVAISKELYVFNAETVVAASFVGIATLLYRSMKQPYKEWADGHINKIMSVLEKARNDHKVAVQEKIDSVGQMGNIVDVTKSLFQMSREMVQLEAQAFELKQRTAYVADMKSTLDAWVRYEASVREQQQKQLARQVMEKLLAELQDPKTQQNILSQCVVDIERATARK